METLYLSKRNLQTLLNKLERAERGEQTHCAIVKYKNTDDAFVNTMDAVMVVAISDEVLYNNRQAGTIHVADDPTIRQVKEQ
jgi:hypothetical protein